MEVKGSVLQSIPKFVHKKFGDAGLNRWMESLDQTARDVYSQSIMPSSWYAVAPHLVKPTQDLCDLFFGGDARGAWESGQFSADDGLRGIYRAFVMLGTPQFIVKKAATILPTFYKPSLLDVADLKDKSVTVRITLFPEPHPLLDARIGGWMEQGLLICGARHVKVLPGRLMTKGDPLSEYHISWT
jgi:hypothetical protein